MSQIRRRHIGNIIKDEPFMLHPDYYRIDVTTTEPNTHVPVGYYSVGSGLIDCIVDGVSNKSLAHSDAVSYVLIAKPGKHVIYVKSTSGSMGNRDKSVRFVYDYIRLPINGAWGWHNQCNDSTKLIDILKPVPYTPAGYYWGHAFGKIRVPIGSGDAYKNHSWWGNFASIIEEYDFGDIEDIDLRPAQNRYLRFKVTVAGPISFTINATTEEITSISYSLDGGNTWVETVNEGNALTGSTSIVPAGNYVLFKGIGTTTASGKLKFISSDAQYKVSGNMASLLYNNSFASESHNDLFTGGLFKNNTSVVDASDLYISGSNYSQLFSGCTNLVGKAPNFIIHSTGNWKNTSVFVNTGIQSVKVKYTQGWDSTFNGFASGCTALNEVYIYTTYGGIAPTNNIFPASGLPSEGTAYLGGYAWTNRASITNIPNTWNIVQIDENFNIVS